jgi:hypothetical protein
MALTKEDIAKELPKEVQARRLLCQPRNWNSTIRWLIMFVPIFRLNFKVKWRIRHGTFPLPEKKMPTSLTQENKPLQPA